jgi:thiamine kinase
MPRADAELLERAFARLPMLGGVAGWDLSPLEGGHANRSWLLAGRGHKLVLRVPVEDTRALGVERDAELAAIEAAAHAGIAPRIVEFDASSGLLLSEYVEGRLWSRADAHDPAAVARLAQRLRTLHGVEPPARARHLEYARLIGDYRMGLARQSPRSAGSYRALAADADRHLAAIAAGRRVRALCHNDLHHRNIIEGRALVLIDWEYAAVGDPMFDLASIACYHDFEAHERRHLVEAYFAQRDALPAGVFAHYCWIFDYMHLMWLDLTDNDAPLRARLLERLTVRM